MNSLSVVRGLKSSPTPPSRSAQVNLGAAASGANGGRMTGVMGISSLTADPSVGLSASPTSMNASDHCIRTIKVDVRCITSWNKDALCAERDGSISVWNTKNGQKIRKLPKRADCIWAMLIVQNQYLWTGCGDGDLCIYDLQGEDIFRKTQAHPGGVYCMEYDPVANVVWSGGADWSLKLWDASTMELKKTCFDHTNSVRCLSIVGDGKIWSGSDDFIVRCWNKQSDDCEARLTGHQSSVTSMCSVKDCEIWSGSEDGMLRMWDIKTRSLVRMSNWHKGRINSIATAGVHIWTASSDKNLCIWSQDVAQPIAVINEHSVYIRTLVKIGWQMWSASGDKSIKVWASEGIFEDLLDKANGKSAFSDEMVALKKKLVEYERDLEHEKNTSSGVISDLKAQIGRHIQEKDQLRLLDTQRSSRIDEITRENEEYKQSTESKDKIIEELGREVETLRSSAIKLNYITADCAKLNEKIQRLESENRQLNTLKDTLESKISQANEGLQLSHTELKETKEKKEEITLALEQMREQFTLLEKKRAEESQDWHKLASENQKIIESSKLESLQLTQQLSQSKLDTEKLISKLSEYENHLEKCKKEIDSLKDENGKLLKSCTTQMEKLGETESTAKASAQQIEEQKLRYELELENRDKQIKQLEAQNESLSKKSDNLEAELLEQKKSAALMVEERKLLEGQVKELNEILCESKKELENTCIERENSMQTYQKERADHQLTQERNAQLKDMLAEKDQLLRGLQDQMQSNEGQTELFANQMKKTNEENEAKIQKLENQLKEKDIGIEKLNSNLCELGDMAEKSRKEVELLQASRQELEKRAHLLEEDLLKAKKMYESCAQDKGRHVSELENSIAELTELKRLQEDQISDLKKQLELDNHKNSILTKDLENALCEKDKVLSSKEDSDAKYAALWEEVKAGKSLAEERKRAHDEKMRELEAENDKLSRLAAKLRDDLNQVNESSGQASLSQKIKMEELVQSAERANIKAKSMEESLKAAHQENTELRNACKRLEDVMAQQNSETEVLLNRAGELESEITDAIAGKAEAEDMLRKVKEEFTEFHERYDELYQQYEILVSENKAFSEECFVLREKTKKRTAEYVNAQKKCEQYESHIRTMESERRGLFEKWEARIQQLDLKRKEEAAQLLSENESLRQEIESISTKHSDSSQVRDINRQLKVENEAYSRKLRETEERLGKAEKTIQKLEADLETMATHLAAQRQQRPPSVRERFGGFV